MYNYRRVFSAYAEVVPSSHPTGKCSAGVLRVCGGSFGVCIPHLYKVGYFPYKRRPTERVKSFIFLKPLPRSTHDITTVRNTGLFDWVSP